MKKLKEKIKKLSKSKKIILICLVALIIILITLSLLYVFVFSKNKTKKQVPVSKPIVIVKDNYKYVDGTLNFLNEADEVIGTYECINKDQNKCYVSYELNEDDFDEEKNIYENGTKLKVRTKIYFDTYAFITDGDTGEIILYDFKNNKEIGKYLGIKSYYNDTLNFKENNYIILKNLDSKYALYNLDNTEPKEVIGFKYDYLGIMRSKLAEKNNKIVYKLADKWGLLNYKNKILATTTEEIKGFNDHYIKIINNGNYSLYDYENNLIKENLTYIDVLSDYIVLVDNKYLSVFDNDLIRLMAKKIELNNNNYVTENIYDENNEFVKTNQSYEISVLSNTLYVNVYNEDIVSENTYDLLEASISNNYDYFSYEKGTLYIYSDIEKTELIGTYSCENENAITSTSTSLTSCFIAKDSSNSDGILSIPIYNKRFIFVNDAPVLINDSTVKIKLYDLKNKKLLGNYINVYSYSDEVISKGGIYLEDEMPKNVIAINKNGKYGMLKINTDEASKAIDFDYDDIKIQNNYLIGKKGSLWYLLDYEGNKVLDNGYILFEIFNTMIVTVDENNKLLLHDLNKKVLINEPVSLTSATETYKISIIGDNYVITTTSGTYKYNTTTGDKVTDVPESPEIETPETSETSDSSEQ